MPAEWLAGPAPANRLAETILEIASWLIVVFKSYEIKADGTKGNVLRQRKRWTGMRFCWPPFTGPGWQRFTHTHRP